VREESPAPSLSHLRGGGEPIGAQAGRILVAMADVPRERSMKEIKRVPAEEFAEHAAEYLEGDEAVSIEKNGEVIGRYVPEPNGHAVNGVAAIKPMRKDTPEARASLEALRQTLQEIYDETGMTEEELASYFDMTKPFPYDTDHEP
jgi:hypothetical protein